MSVNKTSKIPAGIAYAYILLPFLIFSIGWMGKRYWIPILLILLFCFWKVCKDTVALWIPEFNQDSVTKIVFIIVVITVWVYMSGIGRFVFQNTDHNCRNAIYETLVAYRWPIVNYDVMVDRFPNTSATSLIYYIGFWLPSAVIGKLLGMEAGYGFQMIWAVLGIVLVYYFICARKEKILVWPLAILIFFSGMDIVGQYLRGVDMFTLANDAHIEWWVEPYQYSGMTTQLFWVFNQAIPAWLCTILAYMQKNNRSIVFILACCMLPGTFPFVGLLALVIYWTLTRKYEGVSWKKGYKMCYIETWCKDTMTVQNVLGGGIIGIFSFLYLASNSAGTAFMQESVYGASYDNHLLKYLMFIIVEIGIYFLLLYKYNKRNGLYYFLLFCLCVIPPFKVGTAGDFCMRVSIPALFLLMILVMDGVELASVKKDKNLFRGLVIALCIGSITPVHEITRTFKITSDRVNNEEQVYETALSSEGILNSGNFSGEIDDNFFFKYIAR